MARKATSRLDREPIDLLIRIEPDNSLRVLEEVKTMYIIETQTTPKGKWSKEPIEFERLDAAEKYAEELYKEGKTARVVDERYRK